MQKPKINTTKIIKDNPTCNIGYNKVGCFKDDSKQPRPLKERLFVDSLNSGYEIDWGSWNDYMVDLVCRCAEVAAAKKHDYFGIQNFGECWAGGNTYNRVGQSNECLSDDYETCQEDPKANKHNCVGKKDTNYVYMLRFRG
ncbi:uncharacterized protein LOC114575226 [Exaiptasia diaphana]|uniref:WSC domain-containing protein n=1 Tax=Exaiptasia diaphana TaxID=2652724 RepID=A0A913YKC8_EXADI|nr:uncharacterized protein LOC114575226 [Exaiptasia diaphana]